jgi:hypothetical protein
MTETDLLRGVLDIAKVYGWRTLHVRPARTAHGWRTAVSGDGIGWPDVVAVRGSRIVAAELKAERGRLTPDQDRWLYDLAAAGVDVHVWRPSDYPDGVVEALR